MNSTLEENDEAGDSSDITIASAILQATESLRRAGVPEARREAGSLMGHVLEKDRTFIISHADERLETERLETFRSFVQRRALGEPQQYITGYQDFFGLTFKVTPDVLIPRPETELLVEAALGFISADSSSETVICDVGTGSGCIPITILHSRLRARAVAIDISEAAIEVAQANASRYQMLDRISFVVSDCFDRLDHHEKFDLIVSNPPYVSAAALGGLQREVRNHEPVLALSPGGDGLSVIRRLIGASPLFLKDRGFLLFEIGFDQGESVRELIDPRLWQVVEIKPDLQGIPRIVALQKK
jgi:release factor glutamine methyltransferase